MHIVGDSAARHPSWWGRGKYLLGTTLPASMREWVINDLTGPGALRRYIIRCTVPLLPLMLAPLWLPGAWLIRIGVIAIVVVPYVYFAVVLRPIFVRHRLLSHSIPVPDRISTSPSTTQIDMSSYAAKYRTEKPH
jgi:hypothetical protein